MYGLKIYRLYNGDRWTVLIPGPRENQMLLRLFYSLSCPRWSCTWSGLHIYDASSGFSMRFFCLSDNLEFGEGNRSKKATSKQDVRLLNTLLDLWAAMPVTSVTLWPAGIWPRFKLNPSNEQAVAVSLQQLALSSLPACRVHVCEQFCVQSI